jgi:2-dehydro-3-deoxyphosphogluconate aldolase / (4S)-4-hydroxy-2-oxoglutarate aldolase
LNSQFVVQTLQESRLIAILRGDFEGKELDIAGALVEGGVGAMEVSIVSKDYKNVITRIAQNFGSRILVGAGTVLTVEQLNEVASSGATFVVSPDSNDAVIAATRRLGCASFPGAFTPTEIVKAFNSGAHAVKLFPASSLGPNFVRGIRGPLPAMKLIPTGGVGLDNIEAWFGAGAWAVAIGSELVDAQTVRSADWNLLAQRARSFTKAVSGAAHVG